MISSVHIDNKIKDILILGEGRTQGYNGTELPNYNGTEIQKFKAKDSEIVGTLLCLRNILKEFSVDNMKNTGLNGYAYDFSVDYDAIAFDDILDIHKYFMKKNNMI